MAETITVLTEFDPLYFAQTHAPAVSLYLPTNRRWPESEQDRIRYKNLLARAKTELEENYDKETRRELYHALSDLSEQDDPGFWKNLGQGLAMFATGDNVWAYRLNYPVPQSLLVADTFHIRPLIRNFKFGSHAYLLSLTYDGFKLYRTDFIAVEPIELPLEVSSKFSDVFHDYDISLSDIANRYSPKGAGKSYFGYDDKSTIVEQQFVEHFRYANEVVRDYLSDEKDVPLVLVCLPEHRAAFRSVADIPSLLNEGIDKEFDGLSHEEIIADTVKILEKHADKHIEKLVEEYRNKAAHGASSDNMNDIIFALAERKVRALFIEEDRLLEGSLDEEGLSLLYGMGDNPVSESDESLFTLPKHKDTGDLADDVARATYLQGGTVFCLPADQMPTSTGIAALYRY